MALLLLPLSHLVVFAVVVHFLARAIVLGCKDFMCCCCSLNNSFAKYQMQGITCLLCFSPLFFCAEIYFAVAFNLYDAIVVRNINCTTAAFPKQLSLTSATCVEIKWIFCAHIFSSLMLLPLPACSVYPCFCIALGVEAVAGHSTSCLQISLEKTANEENTLQYNNNKLLHIYLGVKVF